MYKQIVKSLELQNLNISIHDINLIQRNIGAVTTVDSLFNAST